MPTNSSYVLQDVVDIAQANGDVAPALATGGYSTQPAIQIANQVMQAMLLGGPGGQPFNWKWNRFLVPPFPLISWQQDYFVPGLVTLGWLESCWANQFTNASQPKPKFQMEVVRDINPSYQQTGYPGKICWVPNKLLFTGTWGATEISTITGQNNPGPGVIYTNPVTAGATAPINPITQVSDPAGNFWVVDFGPNQTTTTCGTFNPFSLNITATSITSNVLTVTAANNLPVGTSVVLQGTAESFLNGQSVTVAGISGTSPNQTAFTAAFTHANYSNASDTGNVYINPVYPTLTNPNLPATIILDGTTIWTAINPNGQGLRITPIPPQNGQVWTVNPIAQSRIVQFASLTQSLDPLPDDYYSYFVDGFFAQCYRRNPDPKIRARYKDEWANWLRSLDMAVRQENRENTDFGFTPTADIMSQGSCAYGWYGPAWPYSGVPWGGW